MSSPPPPAATPPDALDVDDVDQQILEALRSKDRIYVLKLGEQMESLIVDRKARIDLTPSTSYQRLLVHRCSAYYRLAPENDPLTKAIFVLPTAESRIPPRRLCDLVPPESTSPPAFKIMRRSQPERRRTQSHAASVPGDDPDLSDADPSETGSQGGRSNATGRSNKSRMTMEQREAAYNEARSRIFMDFEEKEKEKDTSASSSSISLASGSPSASVGGSVSGDPDDLGSPPTESEYPVPAAREKRDSRHLGRNGSASSSSRSLRSGHYNSAQSSSRNSRASSPSPFTYANIYEPNITTYYDHSQLPPAGYNPSQYMYPYPPPGIPPNTYYGAYPYYHYPYPSPPPHAPHSNSDPSTPSSGDPYSGGMYQYTWTPPPPHHIQSPPIPPPGAPPPPPIHSPPQYPYMPPPHPYAYPMPGYFPVTAGPPPMDPPPGHINNQGTYDVPRSLNGSVTGNSVGGTPSPGANAGKNLHRHNSVSSAGKGKSASVNQGRGAWSYGPGVGQSGHVQGGHVTSLTDTIGPRLINTRRTSSNMSSASSATSRSSVCDDVSSTASSSTTSSSSRQTFRSTASSQHPLPARPDWAVGLKPQPTLYSNQSRHRDHSHSNSSPSRNLNGNGNGNGNGHHHHHHNATSNANPNTLITQQQQQPASLQSSTEFPPLSSGRTGVVPVVSGAWGNKRLMSPGQGPQLHNNAANHAQPSQGSIPRLMDGMEDSDRTFERPPPKSAELFNPKLLKRPVNAPGKQQLQQEKAKDNQKERERSKGGDGPLGVGVELVREQVEAMSLDGAGAVAAAAGVECHPKEALAV